ncbi:hypothetical protein FISHEDRAFT_78829 [Fistulina hepatica ATCC 64428]|uniref:Uncharacterized protein n=1 Tax=Fistulina hepatica ATCC 64428 TaxID=1128425 RepID=A0A0D6ZZY6_9AGAR|nr:hypothetical protein FISHEDRAFT_78829 [Fistulina hepatica ATCC 64428]
MAEILTCRHCGHDAFPPLPTKSFDRDVHELKEALRDGLLPSSLTMKWIEQEIAHLEATIKEVNDMLEDARAALVQNFNPVVEYLAVARSVSSPIRRLPEELLSNVFSYLITSCSEENELQYALFEAGILGRRGSTIHRLAGVCKYWWRIVRDTPMLYPVAYISYGDKDVLAVRRYIEMTSPYPLKFSLRDDCQPYPDTYTPQMEEINYCSVIQELVNAASRWQTADLECLSFYELEDALDVAARIYRSSYPMLKELCLRSFPMSQFFSQERVPALRVLKIYYDERQIELHAVQPILLQITNLDLRFNVDLDFHAILSCAPVLSQLTVYSAKPDLETYTSRTQSNTRSPVLLSHLRRLHVSFSIFVLNIITAPNLVHFRLSDDLALHSNLVDAFVRRSRCSIESLHLDTELLRLGTWHPSTVASSIVEFSQQMPHVTHLAIPARQEIWFPFEERTPDGRFSVFPQLQHLEIYDTVQTWVISDIMQVILKRCGARKVRVKRRTGYRRSKKPPVLRRLDISCPLTQLQHHTLLALSECGALEVCCSTCSVLGKPAGHVYSDDHSDDSDGEEEDGSDHLDSEEEDSSDGDGDRVAYI